MSDIGAALRTVTWILGIWTVVSFVATVPLVLWFRARARMNAQLDAQGRPDARAAEGASVHGAAVPSN